MKYWQSKSRLFQEQYVAPLILEKLVEQRKL